MDPAPAHLIRDYGPARFHDLLAALHFDVLFPNLEEGQALTGLREPEAVLAALRPLAPVVALKLGPAGCLVAWDADPRPADAARRSPRRPPQYRHCRGRW